MSGPTSFARLAAACFVLAREDALIPRELNPLLPPGVRFAAGAIRLAAGGGSRRGRPGERLARAFQRLGPVTIKLGQILSTRADIFGLAFANDLAKLKDQLPPFPTAVAKAAAAETLGVPLESLYSSFGEPIAAASVAQAHPATLLDGRRVAVKVLRPGIEGRIGRDVEVLRLAARLVERHAPPARRLEPVALAETAARVLELELDLRFEAAGASELAEVMAKDGYMRAPPIVWAGVGKRALTIEWADGVALSDPAALDQPGIDRHALADGLVRAFLAQAMDHGVFHADLHEGNLFVSAPATLTAVDFGIIGRLSALERRHLAEILWGFLNRDYMRVAKAHFDIGYVPAHHSVEAFAQALRAVGEPNVGQPAGAVSMGRILGLLFEITALFDMRLRPELVLLQKTMVTVEGVARRIDPGHNLWAAAQPVVARWIARDLSPAARVRAFAGEAERALKAIATMATAPPAPPPEPEPAPRGRFTPLLWFLLGAATAASAAFAALWLFG
ncbi:MAG TPA: 2-polyprenylphenol 6-hydroxylase [Caulobacteraceae bacterium]|nr:2-polyprenylphenol 6-hydroxylase [Caulobacteraceae bacterium]